MKPRAPRSTADPGEVSRLLGYMAIIVKAAGISEWERTFCASVIRQMSQRAFWPSDGQARVMTRIVGDFQERTMRVDGDVVE